MNKVQVWEEKVIIPTYEAGKPDKNPMFLEKRVYQGSSGRIYPHTVIEKISDEKVDKEYTALFLENDYLKVMMLPELGGRIQRAYDKTNGYDFIYYNHVIKPALVGLAGPWISGGIEFNWPQHHRPSTFDPVEYTYAENEDGSATVWMGEIENMFRTEGVLGVTLYPDKAYIELSAKLYNRTKVPQTFLWWANPAVAVNDDTISVFPEDVTAVYDHGKRDVISFPYAEGIYYKHKYDHVNIAQYKNIPVPTSYMAYRSDYNFIGEYDYGKKAGLLHVADHHIAPGKKQWTWGCGEFGKAWDRALTDEDGPYIELMTGCFTDNQPDFTWIQPQETKNFKQYFMPYKNIGYVKNATIDAAVNAVYDEAAGQLTISAYATSAQQGAQILLVQPREGGGPEKVWHEKRVDLSPEHTCEVKIDREKLQQIPAFTRAAQNNTGGTLRSAGMCSCRRRQRPGLLSFSPKDRSRSAGTGQSGTASKGLQNNGRPVPLWTACGTIPACHVSCGGLLSGGSAQGSGGYPVEQRLRKMSASKL